MRAGGGKAKGSAFERECGKQISLWLTHDERPDIMSRNVLSGGSFTNAENAGKVSSRMPGDMMAAHPLAFRFLSRFTVECKHLKDIGLVPYLLDPRQQNPLAIIVALARRQARAIECEFMVIAKQNRHNPIVLVDGAVGEHMMTCLRRRTTHTSFYPMHHYLHKGGVCAILFSDMLDKIDPDQFLIELAERE